MKRQAARASVRVELAATAFTEASEGGTLVKVSVQDAGEMSFIQHSNAVHPSARMDSLTSEVKKVDRFLVIISTLTKRRNRIVYVTMSADGSQC